ncbi:MAG: hypothetical protein ACLFPL_02760 [Candidatus Nanoarchaeia archaeon]
MKFLEQLRDKISSIKERKNPAIKKLPWYSTQFRANYWIYHYRAHCSAIIRSGETSRVTSGTYDLSLLYLTQFRYSEKDFIKIKKLIRRISLNFLKDTLKPNSRSMMSDFIKQNIVFSYILGFLDLNNEELKLLKREVLNNPITIHINSREDSFYIFPYFILLFANSFDNREIKVTAENMSQLRELFTSQRAYSLVKTFVHFCVDNKFGIFQYKSGSEGLGGSYEYKKLISLINQSNTNFLSCEIDDTMFDFLKPYLDEIKNAFDIRDSLNLSRQGITSFPRNLNSTIRILMLNDNNIEIIENIEHLNKLVSLELDRNPLKKITRTAYEFIKKRNKEIKYSIVSGVDIDSLTIIENK